MIDEVGFVAGEDISDAQNLLLKAGTDGLKVIHVASYLDRPVVVYLGSTATDPPQDLFLEIGVSDVFCGASAPDYGDQVVMDGAGAVIPAYGCPAGSWLVGYCLSDSPAPGDLISVLFDLNSPRQLNLRSVFSFLRL